MILYLFSELLLEAIAFILYIIMCIAVGLIFIYIMFCALTHWFSVISLLPWRLERLRSTSRMKSSVQGGQGGSR